jgi:hypothetical protein
VYLMSSQRRGQPDGTSTTNASTSDWPPVLTSLSPLPSGIFPFCDTHVAVAVAVYATANVGFVKPIQVRMSQAG